MPDRRSQVERQRLWAGLVMSGGLVVAVIFGILGLFGLQTVSGLVGIIACAVFVLLSWKLERL